ncbi:hypothetical protein [Streptomyces alanosinicus]|uniref:ATP-dependent helicase n=1 Tax=Streptomyces alanosinicus TaxID=68171 RepID=A0A918YG55_9ACTN|nr:hypothetical protein GCM10010339_27770 [Streptomyces alanosinicus]
MQSHPTTPPPELSELARCCTVFLPGEPARTGRLAFWRRDGAVPPTVADGTQTELDIVMPTDGGVEPVRTPVLVLSAHRALPLLTRARELPQRHRSADFWGAACRLAPHFLPCTSWHVAC